jgi:hypothetical protein
MKTGDIVTLMFFGFLFLTALIIMFYDDDDGKPRAT